MQTDDEVEIVADVPGVSKDRIKIRVEKELLTINIVPAPLGFAQRARQENLANRKGTAPPTSSNLSTTTWASSLQARKRRKLSSSQFGSADSCSYDSLESESVGQVETSHQQPKRRLIFSERQHSDHGAQRALRLPEDTDADLEHSRAELKDGVLRIVLEKRSMPCFLNIA